MPKTAFSLQNMWVHFCFDCQYNYVKFPLSGIHLERDDIDTLLLITLPNLYHQAAFDMRHKILLALQELSEAADTCLRKVSEFDKTFVLDCYKGRKKEHFQ